MASAKANPVDRSGEVGEDGNNGRLWRTVIIGEQEHRIDMQVIRPYLRVITHGGESQKKLSISNKIILKKTKKLGRCVNVDKDRMQCFTKLIKSYFMHSRI